MRRTAEQKLPTTVIIVTTGDGGEKSEGTDYTVPLVLTITVIVIAGTAACLIIIRKNSGEKKS